MIFCPLCNIQANDPKELFILDNASHYECYEGEAFDQVLSKQLQWFDKSLK